MEWSVVRRKHKRGSVSSRSIPTSAAPTDVQKTLSTNSTAGKDGVGTRESAQPAAILGNSNEVEDEVDEERLFGQMQRAICKVEESQFFSRFLKQMQDLEVVEMLSGRGEEMEGVAGSECRGLGLGFRNGEEGDELGRPLVRLLVYGVGSIANSGISRCQIALALLLKGRMEAFGEISVYDPVMVPSERRVMKRLGCVPLEGNDGGRMLVKGPSLMYMPHCDVELYESVLQANLKPGVKQEIVILGNSFRTYQERWSVSPLPQGERPTCLLEVQPSVEEVPVVDEFSPNAFNDTSWHFFSKGGIGVS